MNKALLARALEDLAVRDPVLASVLAKLGPPPLWARPPGFPTLLRIILEQQVSLASAKAAFDRLQAIVSPLTPERFLRLDDATLKAVGFSRQKASYGRNLAQDLASGNLDLEELSTLDDEDARARLIKLKGIGPWTADIYLLMAMRRPDVLARGGPGSCRCHTQRIRAQIHSRPGPIGSHGCPVETLASRRGASSLALLPQRRGEAKPLRPAHVQSRQRHNRLRVFPRSRHQAPKPPGHW